MLIHQAGYIQPALSKPCERIFPATRPPGVDWRFSLELLNESYLATKKEGRPEIYVDAYKGYPGLSYQVKTSKEWQDHSCISEYILTCV